MVNLFASENGTFLSFLSFVVDFLLSLHTLMLRCTCRFAERVLIHSRLLDLGRVSEWRQHAADIVHVLRSWTTYYWRSSCARRYIFSFTFIL